MYIQYDWKFNPWQASPLADPDIREKIRAYVRAHSNRKGQCYIIIRRYSPLQGPTLALALKTQLVPDVKNKNPKLDTRKSFHYQGQNGSL